MEGEGSGSQKIASSLTARCSGFDSLRQMFMYDQINTAKFIQMGHYSQFKV